MSCCQCCHLAILADLAYVVDLAFVGLVLPMFFQCFHLKVNTKSTLATDATSFIIKRMHGNQNAVLDEVASLAHTQPSELVTHLHLFYISDI